MKKSSFYRAAFFSLELRSDLWTGVSFKGFMMRIFKGLIWGLGALAALMIILLHWEDAWSEVEYWAEEFSDLWQSGDDLSGDHSLLSYSSDKAMAVDAAAGPLVRQTYIVTSREADPALIGVHYAADANQATGQPPEVEGFYGYRPVLYSGDAARGSYGSFRSEGLCHQLVANLSYSPADEARPIRVFDRLVRVHSLHFLPRSNVAVVFADGDSNEDGSLDCRDEMQLAIINVHQREVFETGLTYVSGDFATFSDFSNTVIVTWSRTSQGLAYTLVDTTTGTTSPMAIEVPLLASPDPAEPEADRIIITGERIPSEPIEVSTEMLRYNGPE